MRYLWI